MNGYIINENVTNFKTVRKLVKECKDHTKSIVDLVNEWLEIMISYNSSAIRIILNSPKSMKLINLKTLELNQLLDDLDYLQIRFINADWRDKISTVESFVEILGMASEASASEFMSLTEDKSKLHSVMNEIFSNLVRAEAFNGGTNLMLGKSKDKDEELKQIKVRFMKQFPINVEDSFPNIDEIIEEDLDRFLKNYQNSE